MASTARTWPKRFETFSRTISDIALLPRWPAGVIGGGSIMPRLGSSRCRSHARSASKKCENLA
jgi:hypothetical protein